MNNKSFYIIGAFAAMISMLPRIPVWLDTVMLTLICGIALYFFYNRWQRQKRFKLMMLLMLIIAVLLNPFYAFPMPNPAIMLSVKIFAAILFWLASRGEAIVTHSYFPFDGKNATMVDEHAEGDHTTPTVGPRD